MSRLLIRIAIFWTFALPSAKFVPRLPLWDRLSVLNQGVALMVLAVLWWVIAAKIEEEIEKI